MTERGAQQLQRSARSLQIGPSRLFWGTDGGLHIEVDEWTSPWPQRLRGHIHLQPQVLPGRDFALDEAGRHCWQPISPRARVELDFKLPRLRWQGEAYFDANRGERPLERDFSAWSWSRSALSGQRSRLLYEMQARDGAGRELALDIEADGHIGARPLPPRWVLPATGWGLTRSSRSEQPPELLATLESGPFYSRSLLRDRLDGTVAVHESLSLQRFRQPWVQAMLPFRMPRWAAGSSAR
ncbi:carotenoid 1,2-hydratase [soil metagenome]